MPHASTKANAPLCKSKESAFQRIIRLASIKEQASSKLQDRLLREGYSEDEVAEALLRAIDCNIVNDHRYAECYLRSRISSGKGLRGSLKELDSLGISIDGNEDLEACVLDFEENEEEQALQVLMRKPPRSKNAREAAYRRLISKGYSAQVASSVAKKWAAGL